MDILKHNLVTAPILVFPDWQKEFHIHMDALSTVLDALLSHLGEGEIDHPIVFSSRKLSPAETNYTIKEREGLKMVYSLNKFRHYMLGSHFNMYTNHSAIRYIVIKLVLRGNDL
jgi:hypothetical protein